MSRRDQYEGTYQEPVAPSNPSYSREQLRNYGRGINVIQRSIGRNDETIKFLEARKQARENEGKSTSGTQRRIDALRADKAREQEDLQNIYSGIGAANYDNAQRYAPRNYRTDKLNQGNYAPGEEPNRTAPSGSGYTGVRGAPGDPRVQTIRGRRVFVSARSVSLAEQSDRERLREIQRRPGIARFQSTEYKRRYGDTATTTLTDGTLLTSLGAVNVRRPIATGRDNRPLYANQIGRSNRGPMFAPERERVAVDFFSVQNRDAIRAGAASGQYKSASDIFKNANTTPKTERRNNGNRLGYSNFSYDVRGGTGSISNSSLQKNRENTKSSLKFVSQEQESFGYPFLRSGIERQEKYQQGFEVRQQRFDRFTSYLTFGGGTPRSQRSFFGRLGQDVVSAPIGLGAVPFADQLFVVGQKSALTVGAAAIRETRPRVAPELFRSLEGPKTALSDPAVLTGAVVGAGALGYSQFNVARASPRSVSFRADSAVAGDTFLTGRTVSGSARVAGSAEASFRYGPFNMFSRKESAPATGMVTFSGERLAGRAAPYRVGIQGVTGTTIRGKPYYSDVSYSGVYSARTGRAGLQLSPNSFFVSQTGRGVPLDVTGVRSSPSSSAVFGTNRYGNLAVQETTSSRGVTDPFRANTFRFSPTQQGFTREGGSYARVEGGLSPVGSRNILLGEQFVRGTNRQGFSLRTTDLAFNDLQRAGVYTPRSVRSRQGFGDVVNSLRQSRRGNVRSNDFTGELLFEQPRAVRSPRSVSNPRAPSFGGLPLGETRLVSSRLPTSAFGLGSRSRSRDAQYSSSLFSQQNIFGASFGTRARTSPVSATRQDRIAGFAQNSAFDTRSLFDQSFGSFSPSSPPRGRGSSTGFFPRNPRPPQPRGFSAEVNGQLNFGSNNGFGLGKRNFAYTPSLVAIDLGITSTNQKIRGGTFTGLELRPLLVSKRRKKR